MTVLTFRINICTQYFIQAIYTCFSLKTNKKKWYHCINIHISVLSSFFVLWSVTALSLWRSSKYARLSYQFVIYDQTLLFLTGVMAIPFDCGTLSIHHLLRTFVGIVHTLKPGQNGRRFADDTFKRIFLNENFRISIKISLKFVPKRPINNNPALVQIMAWRRSGDKPLSEQWWSVYWRIYASLGLDELTKCT